MEPGRPKRPRRLKREPGEGPPERPQDPEESPTSEPDAVSVPRSPTDRLLHGCRSVDHFKKLNAISEGTFGAVFRAQNRTTGDIVALKQVKYIDKIWEEGFPMPVLREISILLELQHENIVNVREVVVGSGPHMVFMVMEYVEHEVKVLLEENKPAFSLSEKKSLLQQLLRGLAFLHENWVLHRDIKTTNLLYSNNGVLKICDFGLARKFGDPIEPYSRNVVTLWYRAPELLLGQREYTEAVDVWSAGCVFAELMLRRPIFKSSSEAETLGLIFGLCGTPTQSSWPEFFDLPVVASRAVSTAPHAPTWRKSFPSVASSLGSGAGAGEPLSDVGLDLLKRMLDPNPRTRISAQDAKGHPFLAQEKPMPRPCEWMPTVPDTNTQDRKPRHREGSLGSLDARARSVYHGAEKRFAGRVDAAEYLQRMEAAVHLHAEKKRSAA